jgi:hypothetical protein
MNNKTLRHVALLAALAAPVQSYAATFNGLDDNTAPPAVIVPQTTAAPQTPASPSPPIGLNGYQSFAPFFPSQQMYSRGR